MQKYKSLMLAASETRASNVIGLLALRRDKSTPSVGLGSPGKFPDRIERARSVLPAPTFDSTERRMRSRLVPGSLHRCLGPVSDPRRRGASDFRVGHGWRQGPRPRSPSGASCARTVLLVAAVLGLRRRAEWQIVLRLVRGTMAARMAASTTAAALGEARSRSCEQNDQRDRKNSHHRPFSFLRGLSRWQSRPRPGGRRIGRRDGRSERDGKPHRRDRARSCADCDKLRAQT
jgi:hypothetical protein